MWYVIDEVGTEWGPFYSPEAAVEWGMANCFAEWDTKYKA